MGFAHQHSMKMGYFIEGTGRALPGTSMAIKVGAPRITLTLAPLPSMERGRSQTICCS